MLTDGRTTDGRTTDAGVTGILIAHLGAFGSGELIKIPAKYKCFTVLSQPQLEEGLTQQVNLTLKVLRNVVC